MERVNRLTVGAVGAALLLISVTACQSGGNTASGGDTASGPQTVVMYSADTANTTAYEQVLAPFEKQNNAKVKIIAYPSASFLTQFQNAVRANSQIDVMMANGQDVRTLKSKGLLAPLDGVVNKSALESVSVDPFVLSDKLYAAGIGTINSSGIVFNADLVKKYGLTVPATFDDLKADAAKLQGTGISLLAPAGGNIYLWPMWLMQTLQQSSGDQPTKITEQSLQGQVNFEDPTYLKALQAIADLGTTGAFANGFQGLSEDAAVAQILQQKSVMFYGGTWDISNIANKAQFGLGVVPFPTFDATASKPVGGVQMAMTIYAKGDPSRRALSEKLVQFMTSAAGDTAILSATKAAFPLPATKGVEVKATSPIAKTVATELVPKTFTFLDWYWPKEVTSAVQQNVQSLAGGKTDAATAAKAIADAFQQAKTNGWQY